MEITLDIDRSIPAFVRFWTGDEVGRLVEQIKKLVRAGTVAAGSPMPSARQLANDLEIDERIVVKAYRLLERDGVVELRAFGGVFVCAA